MPAVGKLIVIEGLEGAGKSTAVATVMDLLRATNRQTMSTREPGGTEIGEVLRDIIKNPQYKEVLDDRSELLLFYAARIQLLEEKIKPALKRGCWVVADRFELSTLAYQGGGRQMDKEMINQLSAFCLQGFKPDLTLYLDITPEIGMQRVNLRGAFDRIEQQALSFFQRVHETYAQHINEDVSVRVVDASLPLPQVQAQIIQIVSQFIECSQ